MRYSFGSTDNIRDMEELQQQRALPERVKGTLAALLTALLVRGPAVCRDNRRRHQDKDMQALGDHDKVLDLSLLDLRPGAAAKSRFQSAHHLAGESLNL